MAQQHDKPDFRPESPFIDGAEEPLHRGGPWIWAPLRKEWLLAKPEETVRQGFIHRLHTEFGFDLAQMRQEVRTMHGHQSPKADVVIAESPEALSQNRDYRIVVEAKAEHVPIVPIDFSQGESYGRAVQAEFVVMHNLKETRVFRLIPGAPGERVEIVRLPSAGDLANPDELSAIRRETKTFTRDEFQRLLSECHSILRDNHKLDPGAAFDEISKILFIKMAYERMGQSEVFTTERLRDFAKSNLFPPDDPRVLDRLFEVTRDYYKADQLFGANEEMRVSMPTFKRIVGLLERFNLSDTSDDVKGIAFERFLGQTFRGELGQFFTPRPVVEFMVRMLDPQEGEVICDPASGTGGFLIHAFEHVRDAIERDVHAKKLEADAKIEAELKGASEEKLVERLVASQEHFKQDLEVARRGSRLFNVAHECIFGVDAEARAARTSKMNMIMHGDGHGGIHYHDGLLDINGIFPGRFDVVITNPPFGSSVGKDQLVGSTEQTRVESDADLLRGYKRRFGASWVAAHDAQVEAAAARRPILELYDIGRDPVAGPIGSAEVRNARATETLFVERCLRLLRPGGRLGIVLPDGILNNPTAEWLRDYVESRARLLAVVSLPHEVFASAKATVKTSLVFLKRLSAEDEAALAAVREKAAVEIDAELEADFEVIDDAWVEAVTAGRSEFDDLARKLLKLERDGAERKELITARRAITKSLTTEEKADAKARLAEVSGRRRSLRERRQELVRQRIRDSFSYPVFMAEVQHAGITAAGSTGPNVPNQLPEVLDLYRRFTEDPARFRAEVMAQVEAEAASEKAALEQAAQRAAQS
jgi:type I restriction enzyme M protein